MRVLRIIAIILMGVMATMHPSDLEARRGKRIVLNKEVREKTEKKRLEAKERDDAKRAAEKLEEEIHEYKSYNECVARTRELEREYLKSKTAQASDVSSTDEYLFRAYLRTPKWDKHGCFLGKDEAAAQHVKKSLKEYVISGMQPAFREKLRNLFEALEAEDCRTGVKCRPGITSGFRDNYRQKIAVGFKASQCRSMHGGSCSTNGWGDGRAVDVVHASDKEMLFADERWELTEAMWHRIDKIGPKVGLYRPMKGIDPMHLAMSGKRSDHFDKKRKKKFKKNRNKKKKSRK